MNPPKLIDHSKQIEGLYEIQLNSFKDERGQNFEIFNFDYLNNYFYPEVCDKLGIRPFTLFSASISSKNVIRGGHGQIKGYKLIQILAGEIQFFAVDINPESKTYNNTIEFNLNQDNQRQILLPPKTLNFHGCLSDSCTFAYLWENGYVKQSEQLHGKWNEFNLPWKIKEPILSERDK